MTTVKVHAEIDLDGKLRLEVPVGLPAGNAEVLVVVQPEVAKWTRKGSPTNWVGTKRFVRWQLGAKRRR